MRLSTKVLPSGCLSLTNSGCAPLSLAATGLPSLSRNSADTRTVSPGRYRSRPDHANTSNQADSRPETANSDRSSAGWLNGSSEMSRSEEHTSELQSLMRISYAVFCLKKKNKKHHK